MTVLCTFRRPFMGRPVPRQLMRNELLNLTTIVPATAYHRRSYAERYSRSMQPRITVVTLGVDDLERALRFSRDGLGLATEGSIGKELAYGAVVFIELQPVYGWRSGRAAASPMTRGWRWVRPVPRSLRSGTMCRPRGKSMRSCSR